VASILFPERKIKLIIDLTQEFSCSFISTHDLTSTLLLQEEQVPFELELIGPDDPRPIDVYWVSYDFS